MFSDLRWTLLLAGVAAVAAAAPVLAPRDCPTSAWLLYEGICYWRSTSAASAESVTHLCHMAAAGAGPASVQSPRMNAFLAEELLEGGEAWIGLERTGAGAWGWVDGTELLFETWQDGEPPEKEAGVEVGCAVLNVNSSVGLWGGRPCAEKHLFVCQHDDEDAVKVEDELVSRWSMM